ncbi:MAG TPA: hypothetical protein V6C85_31795 [Allocoleopsis sp.]
MSNQPTQSNPWLQLALKAKELISHEPPAIQASLRRMERKIYPETAKALFRVGRRAA